MKGLMWMHKLRNLMVNCELDTFQLHSRQQRVIGGAFKEALINCEKRINQCHPINPLSFDKLPYNHNLRQLEKVAGTAVKCSA